MLEQYINKFWIQVFKDSVFINKLLLGTEDTYDQQEMNIQTLNNALSRYTIDVFRPQKWLFVTYDEVQMNLDAMLFDQEDVYFNGLYDFGDRLHNFFTLPIHPSIKKIPFIMSSPVNPEVILQENVDYMVNYDRNLIFFRDNPFIRGFEQRFLDSIDDPELGIGLWFYKVNQDYNDVNDIYAETIKLNVESSEYFKKIVNAIWDLRVEGGTIDNVNNLLISAVNADFIHTGGRYTREWVEGSRQWVQIGDNVYSAPENTGIIPDVNDDIIDGQMIWDSVQIFTGLDTIPYEAFPALHLSQNFIGSEFTDGVMVENIEHPFPSQETLILTNIGEYLIQDISELAYTYLINKQVGFVFDLLVIDPNADYQAVTARWDLPFFGRPATVEAFKNYIFSIAAAEGKDLTDVIIEDNNGKVPDTINLFKEYQQRAFKNNAFYISIDTDFIPAGVDPGMFLSYLKFTVPAYTTLLTYLGASSTVTYDTSNIDENVEAFHVVDVEQDYSGDNITDNVNRKLSL